MKQIIVMAAMVLLGIFIAGMVFSFKDSAESLSNSTVEAIQTVQTKAEQAGLTD